MAFRTVALTAALAFAAPAALANGITVTTFSDQTAFEAAISDPIGLVDFNSIGADTSFSPTAVDLGPFTMGPGTSGLSASFNPNFNTIDVAPFGNQAAARFDIDGTTHARVFFGPEESLTLTFDAPIIAFGADFRDLNSNGQTTDILLGTHSEQPGIEDGDEPIFIGYITDGAFSEVTFRSTGPNAFAGFSFDNVRFVTAQVSEPAAALMFGAGLLAFCALRRRR